MRQPRTARYVRSSTSVDAGLEKRKSWTVSPCSSHISTTPSLEQLYKPSMDPAGFRTCAQDCHDAHESHTHTLGKTNPEACTTGPEYLSPETGPDCGPQPDVSDSPKKKAVEVARKSRDKHGWRRVVRNFHTLVCSILFHRLPQSYFTQSQLPRVSLTHAFDVLCPTLS